MEDENKSLGWGSAKKSLPEGADENTGEILHTLEILFERDAVVELRAFKGRETISGYFDDHAALAREAGRLEDRGYSVYVTLNEVDPALLARASNRARKVYREPTTSDGDIARRRWLPLDFDPIRPSGVSATDREKKAARQRALEVREFLRGFGWPEPVVGDSGNGYHLLYRIDLSNDQESLELVKEVLEALAFRFSDQAVEVDTSTSNAARIWKLYGTTARKGDDAGDRPHRRSGLLKVPEGAAGMGVVSREKLETVAAMRPSPTLGEEARFHPGGNGFREFDLGSWIGEHGVAIKREGPWARDGYRWVLEECPWNGHTDNAAYIVRFAGGAIAAGCHHNSCQGYGWRDLREHYEPGAYNGYHESANETHAEEALISESVPWPELAEEALYGLPGEIVEAVGPHTEADPVAVLVNLLAAFGSAIGRGAFFRVGADTHHLKLNVGIVGETAKGRKGMSWGHIRELMRAADEEWVDERVLNGLSSGEGLIYTVRDRVMGENKDGEPVVLDPGVEDKRLLVLEAELAGVLKVMNREGNTLSPVIRQAWDDGRLQSLTKNSPMRATNAHVSIVGHITKAELLRHLTETEAANGFANRFVWLMVRRSKELPFGGEWYKVNKASLIERLSSALEFGAAPMEITWGDGAREIWREVYGPLSEGKPGLFGAVVGRAEAQVVRLAALYAVMDEAYEIGREHLLAALALWDYSEKSARYIFGDATGDPVADQIVGALRSAGEEGMTRTEISNLFGRNKSAERIARALSMLLGGGRVRREREGTGGRKAERWLAL